MEGESANRTEQPVDYLAVVIYGIACTQDTLRTLFGTVNNGTEMVMAEQVLVIRSIVMLTLVSNFAGVQASIDCGLKFFKFIFD
jgi:hypothetical protein